MKRFSATLFASVAVAVAATAAVACTPLAAGKNATVDGSILVAHTCDSWYDNQIRVVPGTHHEKGDTYQVMVPYCENTVPGITLTETGKIPQVEETYTYFNVGYPFLNENQVMIGEHTWVGRDEVRSPKGILDIGNLEVLGLQRSKTAREAIKVMGALAEKYGYNDYGEGLVIADGNELWYFEVCGAGLLWTPDSGTPGAMWVAKRLPDDGFFVGANRTRIGVIDFNEDADHLMYSTDITAFFEGMGEWKKGEPFNWSHLVAPADFGETAKKDYACSRREWRALSLVAPSAGLVSGSGRQEYPLTVTPDHKLAISDLQNIYRDHYEGTPYDTTKGLAAGPFGAPIRWRPLYPKTDMENRQGYSWERTISVPQCSYSFVGQTRGDMPAAIGGCLWFGLASPDTTVYTPVYAGVTELPSEWSHNVRDEFNFDCPFWAFNFVQQWAQIRWDMMFPEIKAAQAEIEQGYFNAQPGFEKAVLDVYNSGDHAKAITMLNDYCRTNMTSLEKTWWGLAKHLVTKYAQIPSVLDGDKLVSPGYSNEWLRAVDFGAVQAEETAKGL